MQKYLCRICDYLYDSEKGDPDGGIAPGTAFEDIPDSWVCPICKQPKSVFIPVAQDSPYTYNSVAEADLDKIL